MADPFEVNELEISINMMAKILQSAKVGTEPERKKLEQFLEANNKSYLKDLEKKCATAKSFDWTNFTTYLSIYDCGRIADKFSTIDRKEIFHLLGNSTFEHVYGLHEKISETNLRALINKGVYVLCATSKRLHSETERKNIVFIEANKIK